MNSLISKGLKTLLFTIALCAIISTQAMEQPKDKPTSCEVTQEQTDTVVERMYNAFSTQLELRFPKKPTNFYEAIVRLKCIAALLKKSEMALNENFHVTQHKCIINNVEQPHHMLDPIFNHWFKTAYNKILIEHPKTIESVTIIINKLFDNTSIEFNNIFVENTDEYRKAIKKLPKIVKANIIDKLTVLVDKYAFNNRVITSHNPNHRLIPHLLHRDLIFFSFKGKLRQLAYKVQTIKKLEKEFKKAQPYQRHSTSLIQTIWHCILGGLGS